MHHHHLRGLVLCAWVMACVVSSPAIAATYKAQLDDATIVHFLNRVTFGATPQAINDVKHAGFDAYLNHQLNPRSLPACPRLDEMLRPYQASQSEMEEMRHEFNPKNRARLKMDDPDRLMSMRKEARDAIQDLVARKIINAAYSPAQLQEVMTDFWFNHFNVFAQKGAVKYLVADYERDAIRPYVFGKFRDLLGATAHHPAMLVYLDNQLNTDPNSDKTGKKKNGINENYAREVMELHTLGVDAGYTQADVTALARILTGWGIKQNGDTGAEFAFQPRRHDSSDKHFLGATIQGTGEAEVEEALDMLARHPSTAHHISLQLAQYFVSDSPPPALVDAMAKKFRETDGNITDVLLTMFHSPEFWDEKTTNVKFKPPFRYIVSAMRAGNIQLDEMRPAIGALRNLGDLPYYCLTPNGYPSSNAAWLNSDALLKRIEMARFLVARSTTDVALEPILQSMGNQLSDGTKASITSAPAKQQPVLALSSPEFLYY